MQIARIFSNQLDSSEYTLRGYLPEPRKFGMIIRDNFGNVSDTLIPPGGTLTPLFEEKLDKSEMSIVILGSDVSFTNWEGRDYYLIDDDLVTLGISYNYTDPGASFTLDLGKKAKLSRFLLHQRLEGSRYYKDGNWKNFEVYACYDTPSASGDWSEWTLVKSFSMIKPSGAPTGTNTDEDILSATNGHEFAFSPTMELVRYLRFKLLAGWPGATAGYSQAAEITPYGYYPE